MPDKNGAEFVRRALAAATTPEEREAVKHAADHAAEAINALVVRAEGLNIDIYPITAARQRVIQEPEAVVQNTWPRPAPAFFSPFEQNLYQRELATARKLCADLIKQRLRPRTG